MSFNYDSSSERIAEHLADLDQRGIRVTKLTRKTEDLEALLRETECREIFGAHVYLGISNFAAYSSAPIVQANLYKKFLRSLNAYQCELAWITEHIFGAYFVHFQGDRCHALLYRPIDDATTIAKRAVLLQLAHRDWVATVFNRDSSFPEPFVVTSGADVGDVIGTRNGDRQEQELLFLGSAANRAAKIIKRSQARVKTTLFGHLPANYQSLCTATGTGTYAIACTSAQLDSLMAAEKLSWNRDALRKRLADRETLALDDITYEGARDRVDFTALGLRTNKHVLAATVFADVDGFTAYVESQKTDADKAAALRIFHAVRRESARIATRDYGGVKVQFQGDRIQVLVNTPKDDEHQVAVTAVDIAIALSSAMQVTLRQALGPTMQLKYAIGVDIGTTLATRFGPRGDRDNVCLGDAVVNAADLQERLSKGGQIVVSSRVYSLLPDTHRKYFAPIPGEEAYVTTHTVTTADIEKARAFNTFATVGIIGAATAVIGAAVAAARQPEPPPKSWCP